MAFQPVPNVAHVALNQQLHNEQIQNNLYFRKDGGEFSLSDLETLAGDIATWWGNTVADFVSSDLTLRNVVATSLQDEIAPQYTYTTGLPTAGALVGAAMPGSVSIVVSFRTGFTGRSARGRNYISGLRDSDVSGNVVSPGITAGLLVAYSELLVPVNFGGFFWVVVQRYSSGVELPAGVPRNVASVVMVDSNVDSQRRRLAGRGA